MSREDFADTVQKTTEHHSPHFIAKVYKKSPHLLSGTGVSVVVSGKIVKKAVDRNTLKRRIYNLLRKHINTKTDKNVVIITKKGVGKLSFPEIKKELEDLFEKVKI